VSILKFAAAAAVMVAVSACDTTERQGREARPEVDAALATVEGVEWPSTFEAGGVVRAALMATIASRIPGSVVAVHVEAGDAIRRGQHLVTLDARELRANADRAAAALTAARETTRAADAHRDAAEAALTLALARHDRVRTLHDSRSATPQELDDAVAAMSGASAGLAAARAQAAASVASLEAAQAAAEAAQVALSHAVLMAPFDGVVASRSVDPGALAMPGMELLAVESGGGYRLEVQLDESRRGQLGVGDEAEMSIDAPDRARIWTKARVTEIARVDPRQHSFLVKLDLGEITGVHSGAFGRARFLGPSRRTLAGPASAVVRRGQLWFAFALDRGNVARLRVLTPGETREGRVEIRSGLAPGDRLVLDPPPHLQDGARIRIAEATASRQLPTGVSR
jgi:multidrug resistance efflux pump